MALISAFEVLGPNMVGPSSSHTAGAAAIAYLAHKMIHPPIVKVTFTLYGSFSHTYAGHGTDRALLGGLMGFRTDDLRIRQSFEIADQKGITYEFVPNDKETDIYPNTVDIEMTNAQGQVMVIRGESIGGGKVCITKINHVDVQYTGEYSALIVIHKDVRGVVAHATAVLSHFGVNLAYMRMFREAKGSTAYTIAECDGKIPRSVIELVKDNPNVYEAMIVEP